jgi:hypothetical protein
MFRYIYISEDWRVLWVEGSNICKSDNIVPNQRNTKQEVQFYEKIKLASCGQMIDVQVEHYSLQSSDE